ncbi:DUF6146 family protein [Maribacter aestuarii]|uniref:DUF6146 family protein n=1 Tax=Maribacter aestuarii TaxID=1130723 RepID=UPI00248B3824|nr:DUF6146 family protein [Maribacter aestuarii]
MKKNRIIKKLMSFSGIVIGILVMANCGSSKEALSITDEEKQAFAAVEDDSVEIVNDEVEYRIIIIEPGFYTWLKSIARPEGYYSQTFLENRNKLLVLNWNQRAMLPTVYDPNLYQMQIDYQPDIDYGYDVNYKLYNYFIFFQRRYNQRLGPFVPRI